jgi:hypothetical protein
LLFDLICNYVGVLVMNYGSVICYFIGEQVDGIDCDRELEIGISRKETRYWKVGSVFFFRSAIGRLTTDRLCHQAIVRLVRLMPRPWDRFASPAIGIEHNPLVRLGASSIIYQEPTLSRIPASLITTKKRRDRIVFATCDRIDVFRLWVR